MVDPGAAPAPPIPVDRRRQEWFGLARDVVHSPSSYRITAAMQKKKPTMVKQIFGAEPARRTGRRGVYLGGRR
jgi:hypothetical protein